MDQIRHDRYQLFESIVSLSHCQQYTFVPEILMNRFHRVDNWMMWKRTQEEVEQCKKEMKQYLQTRLDRRSQLKYEALRINENLCSSAPEDPVSYEKKL